MGLKTNMLRAFNNAKYKVKAKSPEILLVTGIVATVGAVGTAIYATVKAKEVLDEDEFDEVDDVVEDEFDEFDDVVEEKKGIDIKKVGRIALYYAPTVALTGVAIASNIGGYKIQKKHIAALGGTLVTTLGILNNYRDRVREEVGEDREKELFDGHCSKEVIEYDENGNVVTKASIENRSDDYFHMWFGPTKKNGEKNPFWTDNLEQNISFLFATQRTLSDMLVVKGHIVLNDIYEALGEDPDYTSGMVIGWRYIKENENGDNIIDFGVKYDEANDIYPVVGENGEILLTFNFDGVIQEDLIEIMKTEKEEVA